MRREISEQLLHTADGNRLRTEVFDQSLPQYEMNPAYARWQQGKIADLLDRLEKSPIVKEAEKNWDNPAFGVHEKIKFAQELHNIHAETFGFKPKKVEPYIKEPEPVLNADGTVNDRDVSITHAYVSDAEDRMAINIYRGNNTHTSIHSDFASFVETVVHEGEHVFQGQLADRVEIIRDAERVVLEDLGVESSKALTPEGKEIYNSERERRIKSVAPDDPGNWNPELSGDGALAGHAEYMRHNKRYSYMAAEAPGAGYAGYLSNPMEQESRDIGAIVGLYFDQPAKDRSNFIADQRYGSHLNDLAETERLEKREAATRKQDNFTP